MLLYDSFVECYFYCFIIWHFTSSNSNTNKIEKIQKKELRYITRDFTSSNNVVIISPKFEISGILWFWSGRRRRRRRRTPPPHAKACVSRNCDINARIKFIFDTAIDDQSGRTLSILETIGKTKMAAGGHFVKAG